jgi:hypothetical protein
MKFAAFSGTAALIVLGAALASPPAPIEGPMLLFGSDAAKDDALRTLVLTPAGGKNARVVILLANANEKQTVAEYKRWQRIGTAHIIDLATTPKKRVARLFELANVIWIPDANPAAIIKRMNELGGGDALRIARRAGTTIVAEGRGAYALAAWYREAAGKMQTGLGLSAGLLLDSPTTPLSELLKGALSNAHSTGIQLAKNAIASFADDRISAHGAGIVTIVDAGKAKIRGDAFQGVEIHALQNGMSVPTRADTPKRQSR